MWKYLTCPINNASFWLGFCPSRNQPRLEAPGAASRPQILSLEVVPFKGCRSAWIGNSEKIRERHYHGVRPEDWAAAIGIPPTYPAPYPAPSAAVSGRQEPSILPAARDKSLDVANDAETQYPRQGSNLRPTV